MQLTLEQKERIDHLRSEMYTVHQVPVALNEDLHIYQCTPYASGYRFYMVPGLEGEFVSVTSLVEGTIRNRHLENWKWNVMERQLKKGFGKIFTEIDMERALSEPEKVGRHGAFLGEEVHGIIDKLLRFQSPPVPEVFEPAIDGWLKWRHEHQNWSLLGTEVAIFDPVSRYAGTVDALFHDNTSNEYIICDWKTSNDIYNSMALQLSGYAMALDKMRFSWPGFGEKTWEMVGKNGNISVTSLVEGTLYKRKERLPTRAMIVRIKGDYPSETKEVVSKNGRVYKRKKRLPDTDYKKFFLPRVEETWVDRDHWDGMFENTLSLHKGMKAKLTKKHIR